MDRKRLYLDYAATTPVAPRVLKKMLPFFSSAFGNSESIHGFGREAMAALDTAREYAAKALQTDFRGMIFFSSATEANNAYVRGVVSCFRNAFPGTQPKIVVSSVEHASIFELARALREEGVEVVFVDPETDGRVSFEKVSKALDERTALVSVMHGNNEIGAINPVRDIGAAVRAFRGDRMYPLFHTDAAQSFPYVSVTLPGLQADAITISSHKMYGPKGAAALAVTRETIEEKIIKPMLFGGEQEFGFRPGTVNIPAIVGFEEAMRETERIREKRTKAIGTVKEAFWKKLKQAVKKAEMNGILEKPSALPKGYLPHIVSFRVPGVSAEQLVIGLDRAGIAVSSGSACTARHASYSRTVRVVWGEERARESVRVSFAEATRSADILRTVREISKIARK